MVVSNSLKDYSINSNIEYKEYPSEYNKLKKFEIIFGTNTIIKPFAMMIKELNTSITSITMKAFFTNTSFTQITKVLILFGIELMILIL